MDGVKITVRNKDRLFQKLRSMDDELERDMQAASLKSAQEMADMAKRLAPKNPATKSEYAESINAKPVDRFNGAGFRGFGVGKASQAGSFDTVAASGVFASWRWFFVEYATTTSTANPHMLVSFRALSKKARGRFARAINKAAKRVAGK